MASPTYLAGAKYGIRAWDGANTLISDIDTASQTMRDDIEALMTGYKAGTTAARVAATPLDGLLWRETDTGGAKYFLGNGSVWTQVAGARVSNRPHSWTLDDATAMNPSASKVASFPIYPASGETVILIGALTLCDSQGATPSTFKVQTDHAAHGTYTDVTFTGPTTTLTPNTGAYVFLALATPLTMASGDGVRIVATNPGSGTSQGLEVAPVTQHIV